MKHRLLTAISRCLVLNTKLGISVAGCAARYALLIALLPFLVVAAIVGGVIGLVATSPAITTALLYLLRSYT